MKNSGLLLPVLSNAKSYPVWFLLPILIGLIACQVPAAAADQPFIQEVHDPQPLPGGKDHNDVRSILVDSNQAVWAGTVAGIMFLQPGSDQWLARGPDGPVFDLVEDPRSHAVWIGAWDGVYRFTEGGLMRIPAVPAPVTAVCFAGDHTLAMGPNGIFSIEDGEAARRELPLSRIIRSALADSESGYWVATGMGLYHVEGSGYRLFQNESDIITPDLNGLEWDRDGNLWVGGLGGISVLRNSIPRGGIRPADGLPSSWVHCVKRAPDHVMWVGTDRGISRFDGLTWSVRHSRRWLLNDDVRDIDFDSDGNAWIATAGGVSVIRRHRMTLEEKADYYHKICMARHQRPPGLVEKCRLAAPGDLDSWRPRDDDNDGQYTAMYLAMEAFRYAVTRSSEARDDARRAFDALKFLQTVTETDGFVARTVIPADWTEMADPNRSYSPEDWAETLVDNPREKKVEDMWRPSRDGKWLWKGDTSSDEITGHMFGYLFYFDLAADASERRRVSEHVCRIVDYIIECGYVLNDIDGTHTQWAVWAPERLNNDPDWRQERGVNSVEILSFLKLAYHMSGEEKYQREYLHLLNDHQYSENIRKPKTTNPAWRTHIDDELLALAFPCLLLHEQDEELRRIYMESLEQWHQVVSADRSPFFELLYGVLSGNMPDIKASMQFLRDTPLDLVRWRIDNSEREDVRLVRSPEMESIQTDRLLPISEISFYRWDDNPRVAVQGDGGMTESDGVFWMLPYWMGRHYGFFSP